MKILSAIICCDYKNYSLSECINAVGMAGFTDILLNYEGVYKDINNNITKLQEWTLKESPERKRLFDQDQGYRLKRIVTARNMCIDAAIDGDYDWLFFVDSDVIIPANTFKDLFEDNNYILKSGLVHGRGAHSGAKYLFNHRHSVDNWALCEYATCGFTAIHRDIFRRVRFKWGEPFYGGALCSEDPLYGADVRHLYDELWAVNTELIAKHFDNINNPLTNEGASQY